LLGFAAVSAGIGILSTGWIAGLAVALALASVGGVAALRQIRARFERGEAA
jgi:hypothetical protein